MNSIEAGRRVKQQRQKLGLSQADLAKRIGKTRGYVSRLEAGKSGENVKDLEKVAVELGFTLYDIVRETNEELIAEVRRVLPDGTDVAVHFERIARTLPSQTEAEARFFRWAVGEIAASLVEQNSETPEGMKR